MNLFFTLVVFVSLLFFFTLVVFLLLFFPL